MMKKEYIKPIIEMIDFQAKDTIMTDDENENEKIYNPDFGGVIESQPGTPW